MVTNDGRSLATTGTGEEFFLAEAPPEMLKRLLMLHRAVGCAGVDLQHVMKTIVEGAQDLLAADGAAVELHEGTEMVYRAVSGSLSGHYGLRLPFKTSLSGLCVQNGRAVRSNDAELDPRVDRVLLRKLNIRSMIVTPLLRGSESVGVLKVTCARPGAFSEREERALSYVAVLLSAAIGNAADVGAAYEQFGSLADSLPQLAWTARADGTITWFNRRWYEYTGSTPELMQGFGWQSVHRADLLPEVVKRWKAAIVEGKRFEMEFPLRRFDGAFRWFLTLCNPIFDQSGRVVSWFGTNTDVHESRETMEVLRSNESYFRRLIETLPQMVWTADANGVLNYINGRWYEYAGVSREESLRDVWPKLIHCDDFDRVSVSWKEAVRQGISYEAETRHLRRSDGQYRWVLTRAIPFCDEAGRVLHYIGTSTDIHEQKLAAQELERAKAEAESASQLKSSFLANMSHEIRTPLGAIMGFSELICDSDATESERKNYLDIISRNGTHLNSLINDILDLSKVESNTMRIEKIPVSLADSITDVVESCRPAASAKGLALEICHHGTLPEQLVTDPFRFKQVLTNLVGNSIKFTRAGRVLVEAYAVQQEGTWNVRIVVSDTGVGIDIDAQARLFEPFQQADNSNTRCYGGTGLGLALSRKLSNALGGDLRLLQSAPNHGSTFEFSLHDLRAADSARSFPVGTAHRKSASEIPSAPVSLNGLMILVVDDSFDNQRLIARYLAKANARVEFASNGVEAIERALESDPDAVLMDISMPLLDGYAATQRLRELKFSRPILALTAHAMSEVRGRCLSVGFDDHLSKPIAASELYKKIAEHVSLRQMRETSSARA